MTAFNRLLAPLKRQLANLLMKGVVTLVDDSPGLQRLQAKLLGMPIGDVDHYQPYGLAFHPLPGALGLFVSLGGSRSHTVAAVVADPRHRPANLQPGEVVLYTDEGDVIAFRRGSQLEVTSLAKVTVSAPEVVITAATSVSVTAPTVSISGAVALTGSATLNGHNLAVLP